MEGRKTTIIGITGGSGSGKTSVLQSIRQQFTPDQVCMISQDDYYQPRSSQIPDPSGYFNFDVPTALDLESFENDIQILRNGTSVSRPAYVFNNEPGTHKDLFICPAPVIVVEGLFLYARPGLMQLIDYSVYLHAKEDLKLIRRIKRDIEERNYSLDEILYRYQHHVMPAYATYIRHLREHVDLVINNNESYEKGLQILLSFITLLGKA